MGVSNTGTLTLVYGVSAVISVAKAIQNIKITSSWKMPGIQRWCLLKLQICLLMSKLNVSEFRNSN